MSTAELSDGLEIPAFLVRHGRRLTHAEARALVEPRRTWTTMPKPSCRSAARPSGIFVDNPAAPVTVNVRQKTGSPAFLARYANLAAFLETHDVATWPIVRHVGNQDETLVLVSAKPWAGRSPAPRSSASSSSSTRTKAEIIGELLARPEGCTTKEILEATGWPSVSVPAQAKSVGLELTKEKRDGVTRYFGRKG